MGKEIEKLKHTADIYIFYLTNEEQRVAGPYPLWLAEIINEDIGGFMVQSSLPIEGASTAIKFEDHEERD